MKAIIVYDSVYGNTEKIARAVGEAIAESGEAKVIRPGEVNPSDLESIDLLVVGSPTHAGRPTKPVQEFLGRIPRKALENVSTAAFDTGISAQGKGIGIRIVVGIFGYAAGRIAGRLKNKGGHQAVSPEGFIVEGNEGPLKEGELERAASWAQEIVNSKK
ncbi:flavodoxin family protein [Chloroflexota bacterium]